MKVELTGNPFVDTGLDVISCLANLDDIKQLSVKHLKSVYGDGSQLTEWNSKLKAFTQIFGTNNPLLQQAYGELIPGRRGKKVPSATNIAIYKDILKELLKEIGKSKIGLRCWACGSPSEFGFAEVCKKVVEDNGRKAPEDKWVGRDWFPLAGSLGSDAQALPAASQPPHICPKCLFAIHYLPMGVILLDGRLVVFQCNSTEFWYEFICDIVEHNIGRIKAGDYETLGKKDKSIALIRRLLEFFRKLEKLIPEVTSLYMWCFSNSGKAPEDGIRCKIEEIPNPALIFLRETVQNGLQPDLESLLGSEGKNPRYSLFRCILDKRNYLNLYPEKNRKGASPKLFAFYQIYIRNHSPRALQIAYKLAREIAMEVGEKELKRLQRPEAFREEKVRNQFRASMVRMAERGEFILDDYLDLFPIKEGQGITVEWNGWDLIRFYLHHTNEEVGTENVGLTEIRQVQNPIIYYAGAIYNHYMREKGKERFQREVLGQIKLARLGIDWLRNQFVRLAEFEEGWTYAHWSRLCKLDNGRLFVSELLFQMRLLWIQWIYENRTSVNISIPIVGESTDGLPERFEDLIKALFTDYIGRRGLDRFYRDILLRLRRREIGLFWFKEKLAKRIFEDIQQLTEEEWEKFLINDEGQSIKTERLFQLNLGLANLYKMKKKGG